MLFRVDKYPPAKPGDIYSYKKGSPQGAARWTKQQDNRSSDIFKGDAENKPF